MSVLETVEAMAPSFATPSPSVAPTNTASSRTIEHIASPAIEQPSLRDTVTNTMEKYFKDMEGNPIAEVYNMVLAQVETPLLSSMMRFTRGNQSRAAVLLGLSRGTLRKKLKIYDLENVHVTNYKPAIANSGEVLSLTGVVEVNVTNYLDKMKKQPIADVYEMVLSEVEEPLLMAMMKFTRGNQSRAAILFDISRGTLRKKLKKYGLD